LHTQGSRVKDMAFDAGCTFAVVLLFDSTVSVIDTASGAVVRSIVGRGDHKVPYNIACITSHACMRP
jgi:hypothetical protein